MSRIIIENIPPSDGESVSLVEQVEAFLEEIRRKAQKLMGNGKASAFDRWLRNERHRFWAQQVEVVEQEQSFHIRMAVPSSGRMQINVSVSPTGIEVRKGVALGDGNREGLGSVDAAGELIRQIPLSGPVDARSVTATLGRGELGLAGAMAQGSRKAWSWRIRSEPATKNPGFGEPEAAQFSQGMARRTMSVVLRGNIGYFLDEETMTKAREGVILDALIQETGAIGG